MGEQSGLEKRTCVRFRIPGATVKYKRPKSFFRKSGYIAEFCPILDISRGGIRFLSTELLKFESETTLKISVPEESEPLSLTGIVRWYTVNPGQSYKYQIGVQFHPYGEKKGQNEPGVLKKLIALEQNFLDTAEATDKDAPPEKS
jgi:Tfp pilus assembly protein PilZ